MDWAAPLDLYCERVAPGFWNEPLNALSNAAFIVAALWAWRSARLRGQIRPAIAALIILAGLIGVGSFLFHTFANHWSEYADIIPIWSFVALYVLSAIALIGNAPPGKVARIAIIAAAIGVIVMLASTGQEPSGPDRFNGSLQYAPALIALVVFAALSIWRRHPIRGWALGAAVAFAVSLLFRTVDLQVCAAFPQGVHFIWHRDIA